VQLHLLRLQLGVSLGQRSLQLLHLRGARLACSLLLCLARL